MAKSRKTESNNYSGSLFDEAPRLEIVKVRFEGTTSASFTELVRGYQSLKVLTYSSSVSLVKQIAGLVDDLEIIFGREDILNRMTQYVAYQDELIRELKQQFKDNDLIRQKIDTGKIRLFVVKDMISHEKLYLLDGEQGTKVISGSANFSETAISGKQNESFLQFDNDDAAWAYFSEKYERIRKRSSMSIAKHAVLDDQFDVEQLPVFDPKNQQGAMPQIILIEEKPPQLHIINKLVSPKIPKQYQGLSQIIPSSKGTAKLDRRIRTRAVQYVKSNLRTEADNPEEFLSIYPDEKQVILSGREFETQVSDEEIRRDVELMLEYFDGYKHFRGNPDKLARDYFTFMCWLYISPFICDFRNRAEINLEDNLNKLDYPIFGMLYGKSNCGKSELIRWLLLSMFQKEGFLPNEWFTKTRVVGLREENRRYPMAFDDMDKTRFRNHAIPLIKEDYIGMSEYPVVVLSMNADNDTFASEVRKRCLIIYTGASLPDHTGESRKLGTQLNRMKRHLGDALYRAYLQRVLDRLEAKPPQDILEFSSKILNELFMQYSSQSLPAWCQVTTMNRYSQTKHDKVKDELNAYIQHAPEAWSESGLNIVLSLEDIHQIRKLKKDIPDYLIANVSGNKLVFLRDELEEFLGEPVFARNRSLWQRILQMK